MTLIEQYHAAKERHPGMLLLFRMGDFFELFGDDAETASKILGLTLTSRDKTLMAGFPHHCLEAHLHSLLKAGQRIAICDQVDEDSASPIVKRIVAPVRLSRQPTLFDDVS
jgi:DNA mismatch repair protein MutS